jgi:hypothetical protein
MMQHAYTLFAEKSDAFSAYQQFEGWTHTLNLIRESLRHREDCVFRRGEYLGDVFDKHLATRGTMH